jgi:hypothetical protein
MRSTVGRSVKGGKRMSSYVLGFQGIDKTKIIVACTEQNDMLRSCDEEIE